MPSFSRHNDFFGASVITGPRSALVRLRFADDQDGPPTVTMLAADERYGNPSDAEVAASVSSAIDRAKARFGASYRAAAIQYQCDNDLLCHLIGRAAYLVVARLVEVGEDNFVGTPSHVADPSSFAMRTCTGVGGPVEFWDDEHCTGKT